MNFFYKRFLVLLFIGYVIVLMHACEKISAGEEVVDSSSWLASIPDNTLVCSLSIPGAHDAATYSMNQVLISDFAKTQAMSIANLFDGGVRAFDLRPALVNNQLKIFHGSFDTGTSFPDAVESILDRIAQNPSEFAIIIIRHEEEGDSNNANWGRRIYEYLSSLPDSSVLREFDARITVAQLRGRILFLSRSEYQNGPIGAYIKGWYSGMDIEKQKLATIGNGRLWVQDAYNPDSKEEKLSAIRNLLLEFSENVEPDIWSINHVSGYMPGPFNAPNYGENAQNVNGQTADWIDMSSGRIGIIMMDFAGVSEYKSYSVDGDKLLKAVINKNPLTAKINF